MVPFLFWNTNEHWYEFKTRSLSKMRSMIAIQYLEFVVMV